MKNVSKLRTLVESGMMKHVSPNDLIFAKKVFSFLIA